MGQLSVSISGSEIASAEGEWIRAGIEAGILSLPTIEYRMRETLFIDDDEQRKAKAAVMQDKLWFQSLR